MPELNGELGSVTEFGIERATVRLDSGRTVSARHATCRRELDHHQDFVLAPMPVVHRIDPDDEVAPSCPEDLALVPFFAGPRASAAPPAAGHRQGFVVAPMSVAEARTVPIPPMVWGPDHRTPAAFLAEWARRIAAQDPAFATRSGGDVYPYIVQRVINTLNTIKTTTHLHDLTGPGPRAR